MPTRTVHHDRSRATRRGAFTLVEVLVVIVIAAILISLSVPAYQNLIESSEQSLAVNALQSAVRGAQDIALENGGDADGAVVFLHDGAGRVSMVPAIKIGQISAPLQPLGGGEGGGNFGVPGATAFDTVTLDVFAPTDTGREIQLPRLWSVRGYAAPGTLNDRIEPGRNSDNPDERSAAVWYNSEIYGGDDVTSDTRREAHWVFPETGFYARDAQYEGGPDDGSIGGSAQNQRTPRQSFMIRFDGRTGQLLRSSTPGLFIDPRTSRERPYGDDPAPDDAWKRIDLSLSVKQWALRVMNNPDLDSNGFGYQAGDLGIFNKLIGNASHDTVYVKPVTRIALYNEEDMASDIGAGGLSATGTVYLPYDQTESDSEIMFDESLWRGTYPGDDEVRDDINRWIEGDTNGDSEIVFDPDDPQGSDEPKARLYLIQPYSAELTEVLR